MSLLRSQIALKLFPIEDPLNGELNATDMYLSHCYVLILVVGNSLSGVTGCACDVSP